MRFGPSSGMPPSWVLPTLAEIAWVNPRWLDPEPTDSDLVSFVPMPAVEAGTGRLDPSATRPWAQVKRGYTRFQNGDVLVAKITPCMENGKFALAVGLRGGVGAGSTEFHVVRPMGGIPGRYLLHLLLQESIRRDARTMMQGAAGQLRVPAGFVESLPVPLPPLTEQHRIVAALDQHLTRLDAGMQALRRVQAKLKTYRASVLKAACEGRLVPTEAELARREGRGYETADELLAPFGERGVFVDGVPLAGIPQGWAWTVLGRIAEIKGGITKGQKYPTGTRLRAVPYLRVANVQRGFLDLTEMKEIEATDEEIEQLRLRPGDVLFNEGGDRDKLGRGWIWRGEVPECIHQNHVFRARLRPRGCDPKYISWWGNTIGQRYFVAQGKQTTNLASINLTKLSALPVAVPPLAEQHRIVAEVERRLSVVEKLETVVETGLERAEKLRQAILKRAFEGRLVPQDPNDEPASVLLERIRAERASVGQQQVGDGSDRRRAGRRSGTTRRAKSEARG